MPIGSIIEGLRERIPKSIIMNQTVGIILPDKYYSDIKRVLFEFLTSKANNYCVYVTITRPYKALIDEFGELIEDTDRIKFIDCVSKIVGISSREENCIFIDSPTMLEKLAIEITNLLKEADENRSKFLILDSLSTLMVYNDDPKIVTKFFYYLINFSKTRDIHSVYLVIEEEEVEKELKKLVNLADKIEKIVDSFI